MPLLLDILDHFRVNAKVQDSPRKGKVLVRVFLTLMEEDQLLAFS